MGNSPSQSQRRRRIAPHPWPSEEQRPSTPHPGAQRDSVGRYDRLRAAASVMPERSAQRKVTFARDEAELSALGEESLRPPLPPRGIAMGVALGGPGEPEKPAVPRQASLSVTRTQSVQVSTLRRSVSASTRGHRPTVPESSGFRAEQPRDRPRGVPQGTVEWPQLSSARRLSRMVPPMAFACVGHAVVVVSLLRSFFGGGPSAALGYSCIVGAAAFSAANVLAFRTVADRSPVALLSRWDYAGLLLAGFMLALPMEKLFIAFELDAENGRVVVDAVTPLQLTGQIAWYVTSGGFFLYGQGRVWLALTRAADPDSDERAAAAAAGRGGAAPADAAGERPLAKLTSWDVRLPTAPGTELVLGRPFLATAALALSLTVVVSGVLNGRAEAFALSAYTPVFYTLWLFGATAAARRMPSTQPGVADVGALMVLLYALDSLPAALAGVGPAFRAALPDGGGGGGGGAAAAARVLATCALLVATRFVAYNWLLLAEFCNPVPRDRAWLEAGLSFIESAHAALAFVHADALRPEFLVPALAAVFLATLARDSGAARRLYLAAWRHYLGGGLSRRRSHRQRLADRLHDLIGAAELIEAELAAEVCAFAAIFAALAADYLLLEAAGGRWSAPVLLVGLCRRGDLARAAAAVGAASLSVAAAHGLARAYAVRRRIAALREEVATAAAKVRAEQQSLNERISSDNETVFNTRGEALGARVVQSAGGSSPERIRQRLGPLPFLSDEALVFLQALAEQFTIALRGAEPPRNRLRNRAGALDSRRRLRSPKTAHLYVAASFAFLAGRVIVAHGQARYVALVSVEGQSLEEARCAA